MFLIWPLSLILVSVVCLFVIVYKKRGYLEKLYLINTAGDETQAMALNGASFSWTSFGAELFPELEALLKKFKYHEYKTLWLIETEKLLRKMRVIFLRVDRVSDGLIKKIRKVNMNGQLNNRVVVEPAVPQETQPVVEIHVPVSQSFLKNEEERLIIEIAKNPKDAKLYELLGDLYLEMGGWTDAKESYEAAIELNPNQESLKKKLSSALEKMATR